MEARCAGFARNRTRFDIQLQDLKGAFHPVSLDRVAAVEEEKQSLMPAAKAGPRELQDLIAYLSSLSGVRSGRFCLFARHREGWNRLFENPESETGRLADLQRKPERESIQRTHSDRPPAT